MPDDDLFRQFFGGNMRGHCPAQMPREQRERGLGSGVIVSPEGYILTNNHVVDGATDVRVTLSDKREFKARVIGTDAKVDIAVIKIDAGDLPSIVVGDSSKISNRRLCPRGRQPVWRWQDGDYGNRQRHRAHAHGHRSNG